MRNNLPVTTVEYPITDETLIVSRTDLKGRLTYFNDQFSRRRGLYRGGTDGPTAQHHPPSGHAARSIRKSLGHIESRQAVGWRCEEPAQERRFLLGAWRRHPPIQENGQVTGYTSIRTRLPADQRAEAEHVYALLREKKASRLPYRCRNHSPAARSWTGRSLFTGTLNARLVTLVAMLGLFMLGIGMSGVFATRDKQRAICARYTKTARCRWSSCLRSARKHERPTRRCCMDAVDKRPRRKADRTVLPQRSPANMETIGKMWTAYHGRPTSRPRKSGLADAFTSEANGLC